MSDFGTAVRTETTRMYDLITTASCFQEFHSTASSDLGSKHDFPVSVGHFGKGPLRGTDALKNSALFQLSSCCCCSRN